MINLMLTPCTPCAVKVSFVSDQIDMTCSARASFHNEAETGVPAPARTKSCVAGLEDSEAKRGKK